MNETQREAVERIYESVTRNIDGLKEKAAHGNFHSAYEELYVAEKKIRAAMETDPADMTDERLELISRLAWAEAELMNGYGTRSQDDLEGVERLAETVADQ